MTLSFAERRAQTRTLRNVFSWLQPQSRAIDADNSNTLSIEEVEKLCGSIQDTCFDADLANEIVLTPSLAMAEGFIIEYSAILGYKLTGFTMPLGYSLVSREQNGDPGKELSLTISVLQSIINGNENISKLPDIIEKLNKLIETKSNLESDGCEIPKIYATLQERILQCDKISEEELQEFLDQIDKEESYQIHFYVFEKRLHLLKGVKHVKFIQNAYSSNSVDRVINMPYFESLIKAMTSIVARLSNEELEIALAESTEHFKKLQNKRRDYVPELKTAATTVENVKNEGVMFATRVLLRGWKAACEDLAAFLNDSKMALAESFSNNIVCTQILSDLLPPIHKFLFGDDTKLLKILFISTGLFFKENFSRPLSCLSHSGVFPLHKLLAIWITSQAKPHLAKLLMSGEIVKDGILKAVSTDHWEETVQGMISAMAAVAGSSQVNLGNIINLLNFMKSNSNNQLTSDADWLAKYEGSEVVAEWIGLNKKKEESAAVESEEKNEDEEKEKDEEEKKDEKEEEEKKEEAKKEEKKKVVEKKVEEKKKVVEKKEEIKIDLKSLTPKQRKREIERQKRKLKEEKRNRKTSLKEERRERLKSESLFAESKEEATEGTTEEKNEQASDDHVSSGADDKKNGENSDQVPKDQDETKDDSAETDQKPQTSDSAPEDTIAVADQVPIQDDAREPIDEPEDIFYDAEEERLAATQSPTSSQEVGGFTKGLLDQIG